MKIELLQPIFPGPDLPKLGPEKRFSAIPLPELSNRLDQLTQSLRLPDGTALPLRSALLLWHDHLDSSHEISQELHTPGGTFLHAVMHRREPDYFNSKYWWRRVGQHPAFEILAREGSSLLANHPALSAKLLPEGKWDPFAFVDAIEQGLAKKRDVELLEQLQLCEMRAFLETI